LLQALATAVSFAGGLTQAAGNIFGARNQHKYDRAIFERNRQLLVAAFAKQLDAEGRAQRAREQGAGFTLEELRQESIQAVGRQLATSGGRNISGRLAQALVDRALSEEGRISAGVRGNLQNQRAASIAQQQSLALELQGSLFQASPGPKPDYFGMGLQSVFDIGGQTLGTYAAFKPQK
jgi:hypothetical protein